MIRTYNLTHILVCDLGPIIVYGNSNDGRAVLLFMKRYGGPRMFDVLDRENNIVQFRDTDSAHLICVVEEKDRPDIILDFYAELDAVIKFNDPAVFYIAKDTTMDVDGVDNPSPPDGVSIDTTGIDKHYSDHVARYATNMYNLYLLKARAPFSLDDVATFVWEGAMRSGVEIKLAIQRLRLTEADFKKIVSQFLCVSLQTKEIETTGIEGGETIYVSKKYL